MKAMLLAAGRGERLRPITDRLPKALVRVGGKPLIAWHLERLADVGCRETVINVSHLGEQIVDYVGDGRRFGLQVAYSREASPLVPAEWHSKRAEHSYRRGAPLSLRCCTCHRYRGWRRSPPSPTRS